MKQERLTRRNFLKQSGTLAVVAGSAANRGKANNQGSAETLRIGVVGVGGRGSGHLLALSRLKEAGTNIELAAVCDVYSERLTRAAGRVHESSGKTPVQYEDYREMYEKEDLDAVCIATPDHWHAKQAVDALRAGMHVYCEKPMTKSIEEAFDVVRVWKQTGRVMQVGVQSTSLPVWNHVRNVLQSGRLGKVLMFQTEFFRNSRTGQWRRIPLRPNMTPSTINWKLWLGVEEGLAEEIPFDRAVYAQWRRFWPFGAGMYTDLFVHRTTSMLKATGLRFPGRVVGSGGIYLEYDGRDVPDVASVVAEFKEGVQGLITASMCSAATPIKQLIRGHFGSIVFGNGEQFTGFDVVPESAQIIGSELGTEHVEVEPVIENTSVEHFQNWLDAIWARDPQKCNNPPELGAAAIVVVNLGARSYREGKVFHFDCETQSVIDGDSSWAEGWQQMSKERSKPRHISGWTAGDHGSLLEAPEHQRLEGPWINGKAPEEVP